MTITPNLDHHETVRSAFPALNKGVYLNVGTYGIMPEPALTSFLAIIEEYERNGLISTRKQNRPGKLLESYLVVNQHKSLLQKTQPMESTLFFREWTGKQEMRL